MATIETCDNVLDVLEPVSVDNSIESWQYSDYTPQSQSNLDRRGSPIEIVINAADTYLNISESYLLFRGQLVKNDNDNPFGANAEIALVNNAMMHLFSDIRYSINGKEIERISHPGQATSMLGYLSFPDDYSTGAGLKSCWSKDTANNASSKEFNDIPNTGGAVIKNVNYNQGFAARRGLLMSSDPRGCFSFVIPFNHIFGFGEYNKVIYNVKHELTLTRMSTDRKAIYRAAGVGDGKIKLSSITWRVPHLKPERVAVEKMRDAILNKKVIPVAFPARTTESSFVPRARTFQWRTNVVSGIEKPRWIIVGFQIDRINSQEQNPAVFDHLNLTSAHVMLNSERYPIYDVTCNFPRNDYSVFYEMFDNFKKEYYGFNALVGRTQVNFPAFKSLFPIIVFDVRRQNEKIKNGIIDMQLHFDFSENVPENTTAYVLVISDRMYRFESDGTNLIMLTS